MDESKFDPSSYTLDYCDTYLKECPIAATILEIVAAGRRPNSYRRGYKPHPRKKRPPRMTANDIVDLALDMKPWSTIQLDYPPYELLTRFQRRVECVLANRPETKAVDWSVVIDREQVVITHRGYKKVKH